MTKDKKPLEQFKFIAEIIAAVLGIPAAVIGFVRAFEEQPPVAFKVTLTFLALLALTIAGIFAYTQRRKAWPTWVVTLTLVETVFVLPLSVGCAYLWIGLPFPNWVWVGLLALPLALYGLKWRSQPIPLLVPIAIVVLQILSLGIGYASQPLMPKRVVVLVADFDGPEQEYRVSDHILNDLRKESEGYEDVAIIALDKTITLEQGSEKARAEGRMRGATVVIWGWYGTTETAPVHVYLEILSRSGSSPLKGNEEQLFVDIARLESLEIQARLGKEMTAVILTVMGLARFESGHPEQAIERFTRALQQGSLPEDIVEAGAIHLWRGLAYYVVGDLNRAIADYSEAIVQRPDFTWAYTMRGGALYVAGEFDRALADYDYALSLDPDEAVTLVLRAAVHMRRENLDQACTDLRRAERLAAEPLVYDFIVETMKPALAWAYGIRGDAQSNDGNYKQSIHDFTLAIEFAPSNPMNYRGRAVAYLGEGELEPAIADVRKAVEFTEDSETRRKLEDILKQMETNR